MTQPTKPASPWMTRHEAAAYLNAGLRTVDDLVRLGELTKYTLRGIRSVRFKRTDVENLVTPAVTPGE